MWRPQLAALADEFTVVAWDEPGAGSSSDVPADFGLAGYANCLASLIEALALGPAHVAGLSWAGTGRAGALPPPSRAGRDPDPRRRVRRLERVAARGEVRARVAGARQMLEAPAEEFDPTFPGLFAADPPAEFVPLLEEVAAAIRPESLRTQLSVMAGARPARPAARHRRAHPADLGRARRALATPRRTPVRAGDPGHRASRDPRRGHVSNLEQPEQFNEAVRSFCRAHSPRQT